MILTKEQIEARNKDLDKLHEYLDFGGPAGMNELPMLFPKKTKREIQELIQVALDKGVVTLTDDVKLTLPKEKW